MYWIQERWTEIYEGLGEKRYVLADIAKYVVTLAVAISYYWYGSIMSLMAQILLGVAFVFALLFWFMVEHATKLRKKLNPALIISYDDTAPDCHKSVQISHDQGNTFSNGRSLRIRVLCACDLPVEQCSGFLTKIEYRSHGGQFSDLPLYEPAYLHWAMEEPTPFNPVTVYPCINRYLGICQTNENTLGFKIGIRHRSYVTPEIFNELGEYRLHMNIVAAGVPTINKILLVIWNGKWNEIKACILEGV